MTLQAQKILAGLQVRKSRRQKAAFRAWLCGELEAAGYTPAVEKSFAARNVVAGDPNTAKVLYTAHYDAQAVLPIPNFITPRNLGFYVMYQLVFCVLICLLVTVVNVAVNLNLDLPGWAVPLPAYMTGIFCIWWIIDGPANRHTANDNTSGVITLLETALSMPEKDREKVCFVFFDNEEKGMFGSAAFAKRHRTVKKNTLVINFDCVGDGDSIQFFPQKRLKTDTAALSALESAFRPGEGKDVQVVRGFGFYPSDNASFKRGAGVCALKHKPVIGYYMDRIHTAKDTVCDERNVALLRDGAVRLAGNLAGAG